MANFSPAMISSPQGSTIFYRGPDLSAGPKPSVLFFALSAHASLYEDPFNQPVNPLVESGIRVFSWDLPFHGIDLNPQEAIRKWALEFMKNPLFISEFIKTCQQNIHYLIEQGWIDPSRLGVAGLSRGGLIATHLAAKDSRIQTVLGFAPLTQAVQVEEFKNLAPEHYSSIELTNLVENLTHTHLRFYIGNHDQRVGTEACYAFIRKLTDAAFAKGIRSPEVELIIYPSVGFKGHGTPSSIFKSGADWIQTQLLN